MTLQIIALACRKSRHTAVHRILAQSWRPWARWRELGNRLRPHYNGIFLSSNKLSISLTIKPCSQPTLLRRFQVSATKSSHSATSLDFYQAFAGHIVPFLKVHRNSLFLHASWYYVTNDLACTSFSRTGWLNQSNTWDLFLGFSRSFPYIILCPGQQRKHGIHHSQRPLIPGLGFRLFCLATDLWLKACLFFYILSKLLLESRMKTLRERWFYYFASTDTVEI